MRVSVVQGISCAIWARYSGLRLWAAALPGNLSISFRLYIVGRLVAQNLCRRMPSRSEWQMG